MKRKIALICCTIIFLIWYNECFGNTYCFANNIIINDDIEYDDDGVKCIPKEHTPFKEVVSRKITKIEHTGVKYSKWIRVSDICRESTGYDGQQCYVVPESDTSTITISASATIPVVEFLDLSFGFGYNFTPSIEEKVTIEPTSGFLKKGEYAAYYVRKSWDTYKATVETTYDLKTKFNDPSDIVIKTTVESFENPRPIDTDDKTYFFSYDKKLLTKKLPSDICNGRECRVGEGYNYYIIEK